MAPNATKETAHHLYRSLLRTASYLPTAETRQWVSNRITGRFRRKTLMTHEQWKDAKQIERQLDRATRGDMPALEKVFRYTYGRAGPRRRMLLNSVVEMLRQSDLTYPPIHPPMVDPPYPRKARKSPDHNRSGYLTLPTIEPSPFMTAYQKFLQNQDTHRPGNVPGRNRIRFVDPPIPEKSIWERNVALKLERGIVGRFVRESLDNVVPPLPREEWERLRGIALGEIQVEDPPKRRTRVGGSGGAESMLMLDNIKYSIRHSQQDVLKRRKASFSEHTLTPKFLQRMHQRIWEMSPKMEWNDERKSWVYTWGKKEKGREAKVVPRDRQLFDGLQVFAEEDLPQKGEIKLKWKERRKLKNIAKAEAEGLDEGGGRALHEFVI